MAITVEAVYENGILKLSEPIPWKDGDRVSVTICSVDSPLLKGTGMLKWTGDLETLERIAIDPEAWLEDDL